MLTPVEEFWLTWHSEHSSRAVARRAQAVRLAEAGQAPAAIASALKLTPEAVRQALARFADQRLGAFPRPILSLDEVLTAARVDREHARQVAEHALRLFDETRALHQLPDEYRALLETAALLHNVGLEVDEPRHHTAGRDLLRALRLAGHSPAEQLSLACAVSFHRKTVRPSKEPAFARLPRQWRTPTLRLAALLRIADGLDYSQSQTTRIEAVEVGPEAITLRLAGPQARGDGERALEKADLWERVAGPAWQLAPALAAVTEAAQQPLTPQSSLAAVAARAVADQVLRWQAADAEARAGTPLALKNVRAAARRARAALQLFKPYLKKKPVKRLSQQLKEAEAALGEVRDWDVLIAAAAEAAGPETWAFLDAWRTARQAALAAAERWLAGAHAAELRAALAEFAADPPLRRKAPGRLEVDLGPLLDERLAALAEYAAELDEQRLATFHALRRLAVKRCRFAVEFLAPAFGAPAEPVLKALVRVQDRLGYLNDACVAQAQVQAWLAEHPGDETAANYLAQCAAEIQKHLRKFRRDWEPVQPAALRLKFHRLVEGLQPAGAGYAAAALMAEESLDDYPVDGAGPTGPDRAAL
ncbi:MAG: CHAD domain-containing protein [Anaerolineales bacterium]|nr:CHAD domain-containing protein [Anaerolineales bacterium]